MTETSVVDATLARKMWRTLEPVHGMIYFTPRATEAYAALGVTGRGGYFASRVAPIGAVSAPVVIATFFNFKPALVEASMAGVWDTTSPEAMVRARFEAADVALTEILGAQVLASNEMAEAADLARRAATDLPLEGRPLFAGHAALAWPDRPHLVLWHAISLLREYRGDGHLAALVTAGFDGCEALVTHGDAGDLSASILRVSRGWSEDEWAAAVQRLRDRGLVEDGSDSLSPAGRERREGVERLTDELALAPWARLGGEASDRLRALVRPFSKTVVASGVFGSGLV